MKREYVILKYHTMSKMGTYKGASPREAMNSMLYSGNLLAVEYTQEYVAIPARYFNKKHKLNILKERS